MQQGKSSSEEATRATATMVTAARAALVPLAMTVTRFTACHSPCRMPPSFAMYRHAAGGSFAHQVARHRRRRFDPLLNRIMAAEMSRSHQVDSSPLTARDHHGSGDRRHRRTGTGAGAAADDQPPDLSE
jgi:hypothetical protein